MARPVCIRTPAAPRRSGRSLAVKKPSDNRTRLDGWLLAVFFVGLLSCVGLLTTKLAPLFQGLRIGSPVAVKIFIACGWISFPLAGVIAGLSFILVSRVVSRQWPLLVLFAAYGFVIVLAIYYLLAPAFTIRESFTANHPAAGKAERASWLTSETHWLRLPEPGR